MYLSTPDVSLMLGVSKQEVIACATRGELPGRKIGDEYHFIKSELDEYVLKNSWGLTPAYFKYSEEVDLHGLFQNGVQIDDIEFETAQEVLGFGIKTLPAFLGIDQDDCVVALLEREGQLITPIGDGIAIPSPNSPIITDLEKEQIAILRHKSALAPHSTFNDPIHTIFLVLATNARRHLEILTRLSWVLAVDLIRQPIAKKAPFNEIANLFANLASYGFPEEE